MVRMEGWCKEVNKACFICFLSLAERGSLALRYVIWLPLSSASLSLFPAGLHCNTGTCTLTHTRSACLTQTLLKALERTEAHTISTASQWGDAAKSRQSGHSTGAFRRMREEGTTSEEGKLAPCHHNIGVFFLTEKRHWRRRRVDLHECGWHSSDMISLPSLKSWPVCDTHPRVFCFWWLVVLPRILKAAEQQWGPEEGGYWEENNNNNNNLTNSKRKRTASFCPVFGFTCGGISSLNTENGWTQFRGVSLLGSQTFWLNSFPSDHTAQVRAWSSRNSFGVCCCDGSDANNVPVEGGGGGGGCEFGKKSGGNWKAAGLHHSYPLRVLSVLFKMGTSVCLRH